VIIAYCAYKITDQNIKNARHNELQQITRVLSLLVDQNKETNIESFQSILSSFKKGAQGNEFSLIDQNGKVLTNGTQANPSKGQKILASILSQASKKLEIGFYHNSQGESKIWSLIPQNFTLSSPASEGGENLSPSKTSGYLHVQSPVYSHAYIPMDGKYIFIIIGALSISLGLFLAGIVADKFTKPLQDLRNKAIRITGGSKNISFAEYTGKDEIGELGKAFQIMTNHLNEKNLQLENQTVGLDRQILDRTTTLQEREKALQLATENAEDANKAKANFLAVISHEIRTPMNSMLGMLDMLRDSDLPPQQKEWAETAKSSGNILMRLMNDILDFSKVEANQMSLSKISFDLNDFMEEVIDTFFYRARKKEIKLELRLDATIPKSLTTDPDRLKQILGNLIDNAIKFTDQGSIIVATEWDPNALAIEPTLLFSVRDTGKGISLEAQSQLFTEFTQEDNSISRKYGGTGLGLAICKKLIELLGGEINIKSRIGAGSRFYFTLPLDKKKS
jgi:signal transduction histidine kinase